MVCESEVAFAIGLHKKEGRFKTKRSRMRGDGGKREGCVPDSFDHIANKDARRRESDPHS